MEMTANERTMVLYVHEWLCVAQSTKVQTLGVRTSLLNIDSISQCRSFMTDGQICDSGHFIIAHTS